MHSLLVLLAAATQEQPTWSSFIIDLLPIILPIIIFAGILLVFLRRTNKKAYGYMDRAAGQMEYCSS